MKRHRFQALLIAGLLGTAPIVFAEEFSQTPKRETLAQAIQFEKYKIAAAEAQARKDAGETSNAKSTTAMKARRKGQADKAKSEAKK